MRISLVLVFYFTAFSCVAQIRAGCGSWTAPSKKQYDLEPLTKIGGDYTGTEANEPAFIYFWNFCVKQTSGNCQSETPIAQMYQGTCTALGYLPPAITEQSNGITVTYVNNLDNKCGANKDVSRKTNLIVQCDSSAATPTLSGISEPGVCEYNVNMKSKYACPIGGGGGGGSSGLSGGWIFVIILLCGGVLYLLVGVVVKWKVMNTEPGTELIPNIDFWRDLPGLIKDGFVFVKNKLTGAAGYSSL